MACYSTLVRWTRAPQPRPYPSQAQAESTQREPLDLDSVRSKANKAVKTTDLCLKPLSPSLQSSLYTLAMVVASRDSTTTTCSFLLGELSRERVRRLRSHSLILTNNQEMLREVLVGAVGAEQHDRMVPA